VCFPTSAIILCLPRDVQVGQDAGGVCNTGGKDNGGIAEKKEYISLGSYNFLIQLERYDSFD
jgi:hypothetical protein